MIAVLFIFFIYFFTFTENSLAIKPTYDNLAWHEE